MNTILIILPCWKCIVLKNINTCIIFFTEINFVLFCDSLRKSSSDLSCKSFTEIVGSGTVKKPSISSGGGVKKILDRKLKAADGFGIKTNKSTYNKLTNKEVDIIFCIPIPTLRYYDIFLYCLSFTSSISFLYILTRQRYIQKRIARFRPRP